MCTHNTVHEPSNTYNTYVPVWQPSLQQPYRLKLYDESSAT